MFNEQELAFLKSQRLMRLATVEPDGQPDADTVTFRFDGTRFYITGMNLVNSRKYKNIAAGNTRVSFVIDDLLTTTPWHPRGIKVHATAQIGTDARSGGEVLIFTPNVSWSWGVGGEDFKNGKWSPHKIIWENASAE